MMIETTAMRVTRLPFSRFPMLAKTDRAYLDNDPALLPFFAYAPRIESFEQVMDNKKRAQINRPVLVATLKKQYQNFASDEKTMAQIESLLSDDTFTVTTAHQPSVFLGPLYFVYKIMSTIRLSERLKVAYPHRHFVPVFVIGGEDHDFEEVNHITIFNKKIVWERSQTEGGAVGAMRTDSLRPVLDELKSVLGESERAQFIFNTIEKSYTQHTDYQTATQDLIQTLFGHYGLVVINMNDADLKKLFISIMQKEVSEQASKPLIEATQKALEAKGFKAQAFAREINLFYMAENIRERIVEDGGQYRVLNTDIKWSSKAEIVRAIADTPQLFSPNVVLRPLYQETVLPNLAYIGGGGELAYWLERKTQFEYFGVNFPMLIRRNSVVWLDKGSQDRLAKLNAQLLDLTQDTDVLIREYVERLSNDPLSIEAEKKALAEILDLVVKKAVSIDPTLEKAVLAEKAKQIQSLEAIEARIVRAEKQKHDIALNQLRALQQKLFPNGGLQERVDNFLPHYLKNGDDFFTVLHDNLDPLEQGMVVIEE